MNVEAFCLQCVFGVFLIATFGANIGEVVANVALQKSTAFESCTPIYNGTVQRGIIRVASLGSRPRCAKACLGETYCRYFRFNASSKQCELNDATVTRANADLSSEGHWSYYNRDTCTSSYQTSGYFKYIYPFPPFDNLTVFDFSVRAEADAILSLSINGTFEGVAYELVIGQSSNRNTLIRRVWKGANLKLKSTQGILSGDELRRFWFRYDRGVFSLGKYNQEAYFEWTDVSPQGGPVRYIGLGSWNKLVDWVVHRSCQ